MISDVDHCFMPESIEELPNLSGARVVTVDFETTSGDIKLDSLNPWHHCDVLGIAVCAASDPDAYYVPLRHCDPDRNPSRYNLPMAETYQWFVELMANAEVWINQNVKYDCQVGINSIPDFPWDHLKLVDVITLAKFINSDMMNYGLEWLSEKFLNKNIRQFSKELKRYTHPNGRTRKYHDYAVIPADVMATYACHDVLTARELAVHLRSLLPEESTDVYENEVKLTKCLVEIEQHGWKIDKNKIRRHARILGHSLVDLREEINCDLEEYGKGHWEEFNPLSNEDCHELFCMKLGFPVVEWTDANPPKPSFGKSALKTYSARPDAPTTLLKQISWYREFQKLLSSFTIPYAKLQKSGILHPTYNQNVRTGRLSCSSPNMQQPPEWAKAYIVPRDGYTLVDIDLKQIEFRYIVAYTRNEMMVRLYQNDPSTDFHDTISQMYNINRRGAKIINFGVAFGMGIKKTVLNLKQIFELSDCVGSGLEFDEYCDREGFAMNRQYHAGFRELKPTVNAAMNTHKVNKYVKNVYGRRRHLPMRIKDKKGKWRSISYKAFNTAVQSSAADFAKFATVRIMNRIRSEDVYLLGMVHDSWIMEVPTPEVHYWIPEITNIIEETPSGIDIPIYCEVKTSERCWRDCKKYVRPTKYATSVG